MEQDHKLSPYEYSDASIKPILITAAIIAACVVVVLAIVYGMILYLMSNRPSPTRPNPMSQGAQFPPDPRLEEFPVRPLQDMRAREREVLESYGRMENENRTVRIPIDKAMDLVLQRGLPARKEAAAK